MPQRKDTCDEEDHHGPRVRGFSAVEQLFQQVRSNVETGNPVEIRGASGEERDSMGGKVGRKGVMFVEKIQISLKLL